MSSIHLHFLLRRLCVQIISLPSASRNLQPKAFEIAEVLFLFSHFLPSANLCYYQKLREQGLIVHLSHGNDQLKKQLKVFRIHRRIRSSKFTTFCDRPQIVSSVTTQSSWEIKSSKLHKCVWKICKVANSKQLHGANLTKSIHNWLGRPNNTVGIPNSNGPNGVGLKAFAALTSTWAYIIAHLIPPASDCSTSDSSLPCSLIVKMTRFRNTSTLLVMTSIWCV